MHPIRLTQTPFAISKKTPSKAHLDTAIVALHPELFDISSAWLGHIPFAFWLIQAVKPSRLVELGAHSGASYCAFCQAIDELQLTTVAHAIDTWQGDAHTGDYPSDVYFKLKEHHDPRYAHFSELVRATFDEAVDKFADGSIDLLHIDGLHTYDAVRHDFETWLPKVSERGVVLFHDTNVYEKDFGVQTLWRELQEDYASFEFVHGHGLGILAVGNKQSAPVTWLTALTGDQVNAVRQHFARVAAPLQERAEREEEVRALKLAQEAVNRERQQALESAERAQHHGEQIAQANKQISQANKQISAVNQQLLQELDRMHKSHEQLADVIAQADEQRQSLTHDLQTSQHRVAALGAELGLIKSSASWRVTAPLRALNSSMHSMVGPQTFVRSAVRALNQEGGVKKAIGAVRRRGLRGSVQRLRAQVAAARSATAQGSAEQRYQAWIAEYDTITDRDREQIRDWQACEKNLPLISVVIPVYEPRLEFLEACIDSVRTQLYDNWELCIADDDSPSAAIQTALQACAGSDDRIKLCLRSEQGGIAHCSNSALQLATGEFVALLDHDDVLPEHALASVAFAISNCPTADILYSDEDKLDEQGQRYDPYFKTDFNYELLLGQNCISHLGVYRRSLLEKLGGFGSDLDGSQDHDLALRAVAATTPKKIVHIPHVLYHWRVFEESGSFSTDQLPRSMQAAARAIQQHLDNNEAAGGEVAAAGYGSYHRIHWALPDPAPSVTIVIPTRDNAELLETCVDGLLNNTAYPNLRVLIIDNGSQDATTLALLQRLGESPLVDVHVHDQPFNYSELNNVAVEQCDSDLVCLLNDDIEVIDDAWLGEMVALASREGVGAVGARLLYPDDTVQHGGVVLGIMGVANHLHKDLPVDSPGYFGRLQLCQEVSAVTAACLVIRRSTYLEVGGVGRPGPCRGIQ